MSVRILRGDCRDVLRTLPDESVHCVVTSPPYWGLRDYGDKNQIGLEGSFAGYIEVIRNVFDEVQRVLRSDGTLWLNVGDSYAGGGRAPKWSEVFCPGNPDKNGGASNRDGLGAIAGLKAKDLVGVPWRVAFALQADGWYLRQDIIWSKPNPMPESVRDRCTKAHEYLFLLSKSERYYYDADAIAEQSVYGGDQLGIVRGTKRRAEAMGLAPTGNEKPGMDATIPVSRNKRSVWEVTTTPFSEAHFATFPPALIEPCILAGCPEKVCAKCGAPWVREVERTNAEVKSPASDYGHGAGRNDGGRSSLVGAKSITLGFAPSCRCDAYTVPGTCLDPFGGAGTTGLVADRLGRNAILIELNPEYAAMAERRIKHDAGMFADVST